MKEKPIIFSTEMVKAILDDRKTMTRRVIVPQPTHFNFGSGMNMGQVFPCKPDGEQIKCPYGEVGDRLWVREAHFIGGIKPNEWVWYKAGFEGDADAVIWRPSIHMFRWASRSMLEILEIRAERVQDINYWDAGKEGLDDILPEWMRLATFHKLWDSLNAKRGFGWETNCWVWVISFRRIEP